MHLLRFLTKSYNGVVPYLRNDESQYLIIMMRVCIHMHVNTVYAVLCMDCALQTQRLSGEELITKFQVFVREVFVLALRHPLSFEKVDVCVYKIL